MMDPCEVERFFSPSSLGRVMTKGSDLGIWNMIGLLKHRRM